MNNFECSRITAIQWRSSMETNQTLSIGVLQEQYRNKVTTPLQVLRSIYARIGEYNDPAVWIYLATLEESIDRIPVSTDLPLWGIPFAIKDNIDWVGVPTTAGCPAFAYRPTRSATVVEKLCAAGAIPIGKTNMDQFATGLVGTRSPYGICRNPYDDRYIPGGSSSGSGVAVATGMVSFALGTDTAGSGRVPAAFTNIVGLKPTRGHISTQGVLPAVRTLDCVSIFASNCSDAATVLEVAGGYDAVDPFSRVKASNISPSWSAAQSIQNLRVGIPTAPHLQFFGNQDAEQLYDAGVKRLAKLGCQIVSIDFQPFADAAQMLYGGPWVAERLAILQDFFKDHAPEKWAEVDPTVYGIITGGDRYDAVSVFRSIYRLAELRRAADQQWPLMDILVVPTTGTIYSIAEVQASPLQLNSNLGLYTNFVNLLDLSAISIPNGFQADGLPVGLSLISTAWQEELLCHIGTLMQETIV
jgi:allophanate hydrolase